jgi:transcriptional regulator with XRE-family HTH domain
MDESVPDTNLTGKITRLVEERGWNQQEFARAAGLNRHTARRILKAETDCPLRNGTVSRCARALNLTVSELRHEPLDRLLRRMNDSTLADKSPVRRLYDVASQPELASWMEQNPERAGMLSAEEIDELISLQGTGGPLSQLGVEHFVSRLERKRKLIEQVHTIAGTEYLNLLEQLVGLLYDKVQPYRDGRLPRTPRP